MTDKEKLLPCPFCGSNDIDPEGVSIIDPAVRKEITHWHMAEPHHIISKPACNNCSASADEWQRRAPNSRHQCCELLEAQTDAAQDVIDNWGHRDLSDSILELDRRIKSASKLLSKQQVQA